MSGLQNGEGDGFLRPKPIATDNTGCCKRKSTFNCCIATGVFGGLFLVLGILCLLMGEPFLESKILSSMALTEGSSRTESWMRPPVQPHLEGYVFNVLNPEEVLMGAKPQLQERGPYVYSSTTVKDSKGSMEWHEEDGTLTYRPRKVYKYVPELSGEGLDPYNDWVMVPNIPLWTGLHGANAGAAKGIARGIVESNGIGTPFVNVTFDQLLWGYEDELPCLKLDVPAGCADESDPFGGGDSSGSEDDVFGGDDDDWDFKRRKRSVEEVEDSEYGRAKPKAEFVDCKCNWGLFRDRNITMRKPVRFLTGVTDLAEKGIVTEYDNSKTLNWWKPGSTCDKVKGQDSSTLPPQLTKDAKLDIFISLMCRGLPMEFEKEVEHDGIKTLRFIPTPNALGSHTDPDPAMRNPDNECYCLEGEGYKCYKSGVLNMEPCKRATKAPLALSMPHFYNADQSFLDAVEGLTPEKEKHQFFIDAVPEFGFPLAIRPRFQLNIVIGKIQDPENPKFQNMAEEIVLPFLWAQDGFSEPSPELSSAIQFGLDAPSKLSMFGAVLFFVIGGLLLLVALIYFVWARHARSAAAGKTGQVAMS